MKKAGLYRLDNIIAETNFATLYEGLKVNENGDYDELKYAVKEFKSIDSIVDYPNKEKSISQRIYNKSKECVNIPMTEVFTCDGKKYGVMDYRKNGIFLNDFIRALEAEYGPGNIPFRMQYRIIKRVLKALDSLHNIYDRDTDRRIGGYLHLDLQPANIFIENAGTYKMGMGGAKFIDFQSAVEIGEDGVGERTPEETAFATTGYAAHELNNVNNTRFTPATDIYSVGAIAARMLIGKDINIDYLDYADMLSEADNSCDAKTYGNRIVKHMYRDVIEVALSTKASYRYDSANQMFESLSRVKQCFDCVEKGDYYGVLKTCYAMSMSKRELLSLDMNSFAFSRVVNELKDNTYSFNVHSAMGTYMFDALMDMWAKNSENADKANMYTSTSYNDLISCGIAYNNHMGRFDRAISLYEKLDYDSLLVDDYIKISNRIVVSYVDRFEFKKARNICGNIISFLENRKNVDAGIAVDMGLNPITATRSTDLARAYSGMGYYATICGDDNGLEYFEKALAEFGDDSGNVGITLSHMLQWYIYKNDNSDKYKECLGKYLYANPLEAYLNNYYDGEHNELSQGIFIRVNDMFKFLIYLKDLYAFHMEQVDDQLINQLMLIVEKHSALDKGSLVHPLELIYKYIGLIIYKYTGDNNNDDAYVAMKLSVHCINGNRFMQGQRLDMNAVISYCTMWEDRKIREDDCDRIYKELLSKAKRSGWSQLVKRLEECKDLSKLCPYEAC